VKRNLTTEEQEHAEAERAQTWRDISDAQIRSHLRDLSGHPMRLTLGHMLAIAISRYAPHKLGQLPPEFLTDIATPHPQIANA
jgi:hypothetical protein